MFPKVLLQIVQLAVRLSSTGSFATGENLFELVVFVAGDLRCLFFFWGFDWPCLFNGTLSVPVVLSVHVGLMGPCQFLLY